MRLPSKPIEVILLVRHCHQLALLDNGELYASSRAEGLGQSMGEPVSHIKELSKDGHN